MIVTVTPNPALDRTLQIERLRHGAVLWASGGVVHASGKGVNVSRGLLVNGHRTLAVLPLGGHEGAQLRALALEEGLELRWTTMAGSVRVNTSVVEPDGTVTKLNERGPEMTGVEAEDLLDVARRAAAGADWVVACGSLPLGLADDFHARLAAAVRPAGARLAIDASGAPLRAALASGPALIKPNRDELADAAGGRVDTLGDAVRAAETLRAAGAAAVLVSLGPDGALLVDGDGARHGESIVDRPRSTVGSGDALLAGFLAGEAGGEDPLASGLTWAAAMCRLPDTRMPGPADLDAVSARLSDGVDDGRRLTDAGR